MTRGGHLDRLLERPVLAWFGHSLEFQYAKGFISLTQVKQDRALAVHHDAGNLPIGMRPCCTSERDPLWRYSTQTS
jgi:hypothetical protein